MRFDDLGYLRSSMYGYDFARRVEKGWFDSLFNDYTLHPYLNVLSKHTQDLLYKRDLLFRIVPIFSKRLRIASLLNEMIGVDLMVNKSKGPGFIEELANILLREAEGRDTLGKRITSKTKRLIKSSCFFAGIGDKIQGQEHLSSLAARGKDLEGALIAVQGVFNRVESVSKYNSAFAESFRDSGIEWVLSDFPCFSMTPDNHMYRGAVLGVRVDPEIRDVLESTPPFTSSFDWYPYVTICGTFHESLDPKHMGIKVIDFSWLSIRRPRNFDDSVAEFLIKLTKKNPSPVHPYIDANNEENLFLCLSAIHVCLAVHNVSYSNSATNYHILVDSLLPHVGNELPPGLRSFFQADGVPKTE